MKNQQKPTARSPISDAEIVELYWNRDERAIEETDFKYRNLLYTIAYNILNDSLDCEECMNDTYLGVWNSIPPSKPNVFKAFIATIMRRSAITRYRNKRKKGTVPSEMTVSLSEIEDFISDESTVDAEFSAEQLGESISGFAKSLSRRRRFIFISRYYACEPIDTIAKELGVSRSTINKELAFIRGKLKEKLESEGYNV